MHISFVSRQSIVSLFLLCDAYYWSFLAEALRFWDWAAKDVVTVGIPNVFSNDSINILDPTNSDGTTQTSIANPLSFYPFPTIPPGFTTVTYQDDNDVRTHNSFSPLEYFLCTPRVTIISSPCYRQHKLHILTNGTRRYDTPRAHQALTRAIPQSWTSPLWSEFTRRSIDHIRLEPLWTQPPKQILGIK